MAKLTYLLALFVVVVVCAEAIRIDPPVRPQRNIPGVKKNDPRCNKGNIPLPHPKDCTKYIKCVNGDSQEKKCPQDFKFDSIIKRCVPPTDNPVCGNNFHGPSDEDEKCPKSYGMFPVKSDCHKYMICTDNKPRIKKCPPKQVYRDINGMCVNGDKCPDRQSEEESECKEENVLLPVVGNCRKYIKCVNFKPVEKKCRPGTAFNPEKKVCTKEQLQWCKNNDILSVEPDE